MGVKQKSSSGKRAGLEAQIAGLPRRTRSAGRGGQKIFEHEKRENGNWQDVKEMAVKRQAGGPGAAPNDNGGR